MDKFAESAHHCQIDNDTACVRNVIDEICRHVGRGGAHRPVVLQAEFGNRVELLYIARKVKENCRIGRIRILVQSSELTRRALEDTQPDGCFYVPGDVMSPALQNRIVKKYTDNVQRHLTPPAFVIVTHLHPNALREQGVWSANFRALFGERIVSVPTAAERKPPELVELYKNVVKQAAARFGMKYQIDAGALDLLTTMWAEQPPVSLNLVVAVARKNVADAKATLDAIAREVTSKQPLRITGKNVVDALMPDSELATRAPEGTLIH